MTLTADSAVTQKLSLLDELVLTLLNERVATSARFPGGI